MSKPKTNEKGKNHTTLISIFDYQCLNHQLVYVYRSSCDDVSTLSMWLILLLNNPKKKTNKGCVILWPCSLSMKEGNLFVLLALPLGGETMEWWLFHLVCLTHYSSSSSSIQSINY
jgi:hypothetical protein